ncbi:MAG: hypothetical protein WCT52_00735 [Candidatus Micrarchaeia archaeon]
MKSKKSGGLTDAKILEYAGVGAAIGLIFGAMLDGIMLFVVSGAAIGLFVAWMACRKAKA